MLNSILGASLVLSIIANLAFYVTVKNLKEKNLELKNKADNRDIPKIIEIEEKHLKIKEEQHKLQTQKEEAEIAIKIKNGEYKVEIPHRILKQILEGLNASTITLTSKYPNIIFSDKITQYTYKPSINNKIYTPTIRKTLYEDSDFSIRIDRKDFARTLRAFSDNYIEMSFDLNNPSIFTFKDKNSTAVAKIKV